MLIQKIKDSLSIKQVVEMYGVSLDSNNFSKCPLHDEKTKSFKIYSNKQRFKCFGCGKSGDVVDFVKYMFYLNDKDALRKLDSDFKLGFMGKIDVNTSKQLKQAQIERERLKKKKENFERNRNNLVSVIQQYYKMQEENRPMQGEEPNELFIMSVLKVNDLIDYYERVYEK